VSGAPSAAFVTDQSASDGTPPLRLSGQSLLLLLLLRLRLLRELISIYIGNAILIGGPVGLSPSNSICACNSRNNAIVISITLAHCMAISRRHIKMSPP